jgi:hypothetical protein
MSTSVEVRIFTLLFFPSEFFILLAIIDILTGKCCNDNWIDGRTDVHVCVFVCMYACTYVHTSVRRYEYICMHACMYVHMYVQKF